MAPASPGRLTGASSSRARDASNRGGGEMGGSSSSSRVKGSGRDCSAASEAPATAEPEEAGVDTISNAGEVAQASGVLAGAAADPKGEEMTLWWDVSDDLCDLCGGLCDADQVHMCDMCGSAQYCSTKCQRATVAAGKHTWAACGALARVKAGRLGAC